MLQENQLFAASKLTKLEHSSVSWPELTKHCNAQKNPKLPTLKLTKHCNAQKIPKFWHLWPGRGQIP